jgi:hypothetical protein
MAMISTHLQIYLIDVDTDRLGHIVEVEVTVTEVINARSNDATFANATL